MDSSSSDDGYRTGEAIIEIYSGGDLEEVSVALTCEWTSSTIEILEFINRRLIKEDVNYPIFLEMILTRIIKVTDSEFGNISFRDGNKITQIAIGEAVEGSLDIHTLQEIDSKCIFNYILDQNKIIISNKISSDPRCTNSFPEDHPHIKTLLSIPIRSQWILSLANKKSYSESDVSVVAPLLAVLGRLFQKSLTKRETLKSKTSTFNQNKFLAAMSHDLRTPLNGILGMVTLLPDAGPLTTKQKKYVTNVKECTYQMVALVNNFLDFNKMVSDGLILKKEPLNIKDSVDDSMVIIRGNAISKGLALECKLPKKMPILLGDRARVTQILSNLLGNAVKFTEKGSIGLVVEVSRLSKKTSPRKWKIIFKVKDTGIGIPSEEQERIFEFFRQSRSLDTFLSQSGTGFGLSFSRELVRMMGGKIVVKSSTSGSTFTFFIILEEEVQSQVNTTLKGVRILVVDDREEIRLQLGDILFNWGCIPIVFGSAKETLQYLRHDSNFDLGMIDICMPHMSGIELAQELKREYPKLPLIGISSAGSGGKKYFDYFTYKPIDQNILFQLTAKCLTGTSTKKKKSRKKLKILIAEDNKYNSFTLKELLISIGFNESRIKIVNNGKKCVREAKKNKYDVILMDILMPIMDGIEASKLILKGSNPPMIIAASAAVMNVDKARCQEVGISGYLEKPISKEKLKSVLLPLVRQKKHKEGNKKFKDGHRYL